MSEASQTTDALIAIADVTSVWRDRRFARSWDPAVAFGCAVVAMVVTAIAGYFLLYSPLTSGVDPLQPVTLSLWTVFTLAAVAFAVCYWRLLAPMTRIIDWQARWARKSSRLAKQPDLQSQSVEEAWARRTVAGSFLKPNGQRRRNLSQAIGFYDSLHAEEGLTDRRASLIVEDWRRASRADRSKSLNDLVLDTLSDGASDEVEPVALPIRFRLDAAFLPLLLIATMLWQPLVSLMTSSGVSSMIPASGLIIAWRLGIGVAGALFLSYASLHELGLLPIRLLQGSCSPERTTALHRFTWREFRPGRDLAIVRLTTDDEAVAALIGANGDHALIRLGGEYLWHFVSCWARPVSEAHVLKEQP